MAMAVRSIVIHSPHGTRSFRLVTTPPRAKTISPAPAPQAMRIPSSTTQARYGVGLNQALIAAAPRPTAFVKKEGRCFITPLASSDVKDGPGVILAPPLEAAGSRPAAPSPDPHADGRRAGWPTSG